MRRLVGPALLGLLCGCYVFSDEPKARKQTGTTPAKPDAEKKAAAKPDTTPTPAETDAAECPQTLTGVEDNARTIASGCGPVRVRGKYQIEGGSLTIGAGVELRFEPNATLEVGQNRPGVLTVQGTAEQPVRMIADSVSESGRWNGVHLYAQANGSSIAQLEIAGAGTTDQAAMRIVASDVTVSGLKFRTGNALALDLLGEQPPALTGVEIAGSGLVARATPTAVSALGDAKLEPSAQIAIMPGKVTARTEWPPLVYRIDGVVRVEGEAQQAALLSLAPGADLHFGPDARLLIGGLGPGSLSASGTPTNAAPPPADLAPPRNGRIRLINAEGKARGSWSGVLVQDGGELSLHGVELTGGGSRDEGVILAEGKSRVTLENCTLRGNEVGVELRGISVAVDAFDGVQFINTPIAIRTTPTLLAALGSNNTYDEAARIDVERGKIETSMTWAAQAAPIILHGDVFVDKGATLTIAPGARIAFDPGVILGVGYYEQASVDLRGTAESPIVLEPAPTGDSVPPASWGGVVLGAHTRKARFEHVTLRNTSNPAAIDLRDGADATLVNVECSDCVGSVVRWDCKSTVGNAGVRASGSTPTELAAPSNCQ